MEFLFNEHLIEPVTAGYKSAGSIILNSSLRLVDDIQWYEFGIGELGFCALPTK